MALDILPPTRLVPTTAQLVHLPTFLLGGLLGGAIYTLMMYLNFASVVKITTENLMAMMAFSPATAWIFQELGARFGLINAPTPKAPVVTAIVICIVAVLLIFWAGEQGRRQQARADEAKRT